MPNKLVSVAELMTSPATRMSQWMTAASTNASAKRTLAPILGEPLAEHLEVARVDHQDLVLVADSPVWAARARYLMRGLLRHLQRIPGLPTPDNLRIMVRPPQGEAYAPTGDEGSKRQLVLSRSNATMLRAAAETLGEPLRTQLLNIAAKSIK